MPASASKRDNTSKLLQQWQSKYQPMNEPNEQLDYAAYYHRVKEFGASRNWSDVKINKMLGDRKAFEKEWKLVSYLQPNSL